MKKILKEEKAITLIVIVITIIILILLAGITIATLQNTNLFENTKLAKEKWNNSVKGEENKINQYSNEIDVAT